MRRLLHTSSACIYPSYRQETPDVTPLREEDAYPADPEDGYGWEKLYTERLCRHYRENYGLETRVIRLHNMFGPLGTYDATSLVLAVVRTRGRVDEGASRRFAIRMAVRRSP